MVRRYEEPIEVRARAGELSRSGCRSGGDRRRRVVRRAGDDGEQVPTAFLWRGRLYVVRDVLGHWSQRRPWWREALDPREDADLPGEPRLPDTATEAGRRWWAACARRPSSSRTCGGWRPAPGGCTRPASTTSPVRARGDAPGSWRLLRVAD